jgi:beta-galactosidase
VYDEGCTLFKPAPGPDKSGLDANRFKLCYDDPTYQKLAKDFILCAVERYKDHPRLIAWAGWNEPRLSECYCSHSVEAFRSWLQNKYQDLHSLENAWSSEFSVMFRDWNDVFPQPSANFEDGGYVPFLDWKHFLEDNRRAKFNLIRSWIKECDPETPVISHVCSGYVSDIFGSEDILGTSLYTIHADGKSQRPFTPEEFVFRMSLPLVRYGFRKHRRDPYGFWVVETEAGPVSWVHNTVPRSYSARQLNARDLFFVSYGARAILRWLYRSRVSDAQAGEFNMVGWDGSLTERATACGELATQLNKHSGIFQSHIPANHDIVIMGVHDHSYQAEAEGYNWRYHRGVEALQSALRHLGHHAHVCNERQVLEGILDKAKILFCPHWVYLSPEIENKLRQFVENGGILIVETPFAIKNTQGIHYEKTPGNMLDVFGAQVWDMESLAPGESCGALPGYDFRGKIRLHGAEALETFRNGDPAVVSHAYGKGTAILYATQVFINYFLQNPFAENEDGRRFTDEARSLHAELHHLLAKAGVTPQWKLICDETTVNFIHIIPRKLPDGRPVCFVLNMDDKPNSFQVRLPGTQTLDTLIASDPNRMRCDEDVYSFNLKEWGWLVLSLPE